MEYKVLASNTLQFKEVDFQSRLSSVYWKNFCIETYLLVNM